MPPRPRILIADDDAVVRNLLKLIGARCGCVIEEAADGSEALELLRGRKYDVLVLDLMMPGISGYDLLPHLKEMHDRPAVLVVTAMSGDRYTNLDPDVVTATIMKPFDIDFFRDTLTDIAEQMARRRTSAEDDEPDLAIPAC